MKKRIIIPGALVVLILALWIFNRSEATDYVDLYTSPRLGSFDVDVTTTGELRAKNSTEIKGPQGARDFRVNNIRIQRLIAEGTVVKKGDFVNKDQILCKLSTDSRKAKLDEARALMLQKKLVVK